jgi:hypothetical protein
MPQVEQQQGQNIFFALFRSEEKRGRLEKPASRRVGCDIMFAPGIK